MTNIRREAAQALQEITDQGGYSTLVIDRHLKAMTAPVSNQDRRFFTLLVYETLEHLASIDAILNSLMKTPLQKVKPYVRAVLRIGICQLRHMDAVPDRAAIYETVELIKNSPYSRLSSFVNGVLRAAQRNGCRLPLEGLKPEGIKALSLQYDMPTWIIETWIYSYGKEKTKELLQKMQTPGRVCVRTNRLLADKETALKALQETGAEVQEGLLPDTFYCLHIPEFSDWAAYREGVLTVQDEGSILAALATGAKPGMTVLDMCAAPGGKSAYMAQMMENQGIIISRDIHKHRVELIERTMKRLGVACVKEEVQDSTAAAETEYGRYDVVLLDAPCSGLGVLRSKPDIKWHHRAEEENELIELQRRLLTAAQKLVKKGGRLVYSTCTLNRRENEDQVAWFLEHFPDFLIKDLQKDLPSLPECDRLWDRHLTLWPRAQGHDGFFVAALEKMKENKSGNEALGD